MDDVIGQPESYPHEKERQFLTELTNLSVRLGIGITGEAQLYLMERDDYERTYRCDAEGRLNFV